MIQDGVHVMTDRERLLHILKFVPIPPQGFRDPIVAVVDHLLNNGVTFAFDRTEHGNAVPYEERRRIYLNALATWGDKAQMIVAVEELSECQKEICKILRGGENFPHLAEEIADATIMLEQLRLIFNINDQVCECMDAKVRRLEKRLGGTGNE